MAKKKIIDLTASGKSGKVALGLKKGDTIIHIQSGEKFKFVEYTDYGFGAIIEKANGLRYHTFASEIKKAKEK